jgi:hypothetical protein
MSATRNTVLARRALFAEVSSAFLPVEESADTTAALALRCTATLLEARRAAGLKVTEGEDALRMVHEACNLAFSAQALFRRAHVGLADLGSDLELVGYTPECPGATLSPANQNIAA